MLALVTTAGPDLFRLSEVREPRPLPFEALVRLGATSLNRGEVTRAQSAAAGQRPGWDVAGTVERAAEDGSGPGAGSRVVGMVDAGGWAELVAVPTERLAPVPDGVDLERAACLPVAGMTAFRSLALGGFALGRSVLVTGASGGVGHLAVQLARHAGMTVTGLIRDPSAGALTAARCHRAVPSLDREVGPFDLVLEGVGGAVLSRCLDLVAPRGLVVSYASTLREPAALAPRWFGDHVGATLRSLYIFEEVRATRAAASDLRTLCALAAAGALEPDIGESASWSRAGELARALLERRVRGKVVLRPG